MQLRDGTRSAAKHQAILEAATRVFLDKGYRDASMDEVAAAAGVGKQTVYNHFVDKGQLFAEIVLATTTQVDGMVRLVADSLVDTDDPERALGELAGRFLSTLMRPELLRLRRLIIASADLFPELGRTWYESGFERVLATLADSFTGMVARGLLRVDDPLRAAEHFVGLLLWIPVNRAMFTGDEAPYSQGELDDLAASATCTFLSAHRP
jgi:TetR/AcrR family transcriptional regulator, mexJK operon transcriptional repressor